VIFKFFSSISYLHVCLVVVPNWKQACFTALGRIFTHDRILLMMIVNSPFNDHSFGFKMGSHGLLLTKKHFVAYKKNTLLVTKKHFVGNKKSI